MTVSVVIPLYNELKVIRQCLDALMCQTVKPFEIIVVDNNSSDGSADIVRTYPVRLINEPQQGVIYTRRRGFDSAKGDIIATLDADSIPAKDWVERITDNFSRDPNLLGLGGTAGFREISPQGTHMGRTLFDLTVRYADAKRYNVTQNTLLYGHNLAVRRTAWDQAKADLYLGPDGIEVIEDLELGAKLASMGKTHVDRKLVVNIHVMRSFDLNKIKRYHRLGRNAVERHR